MPADSPPHRNPFNRPPRCRAMKLLRKGKVKEVYEVSDEELEFLFTDQISVFDKVIPTLIPHKGETLCRTSAFWFQRASKLGVRNHFLGLQGGNRMRVKRVRVIPDYDRLTPETASYLIPLEWVARYYVAGSLYDRLQAGAFTPQDLGFPQGKEVRYGERLPEPFLEVTTKLEKVDRPLTKEEALAISGLTAEEYATIWDLVVQVDGEIQREVGQRKLIHVDGKKEFAFDEARRILLVDTFGTADEDRFWDKAAYDEGRQVERSKEFVRQHYRSTGYHARLMAARRAGEPEPDIPALPDDFRRQVSDLYVAIYEQLTGESLR